MISITNNAMKICSDTVNQLSGPQSESKCLRLVRHKDAGLAVVFENPRQDDELVWHNGQAVLAVPKKFTAFYSDRTLDINEHGRLILS